MPAERVEVNHGLWGVGIGEWGVGSGEWEWEIAYCKIANHTSFLSNNNQIKHAQHK